jgi:hypothetical protein
MLYTYKRIQCENCSSLQTFHSIYHLYKKNIEANPYCSCKLVETSEHFFLKCSLYERLRNDLFFNLSYHLNINNLLFGDSNLLDCENESNFLVIQDFIIKSKRFTPTI